MGSTRDCISSIIYSKLPPDSLTHTLLVCDNKWREYVGMDEGKELCYCIRMYMISFINEILHAIHSQDSRSSSSSYNRIPPIFSSYQLHSQLSKNHWELNLCEKQREGPSAFLALLISLRLSSRRRASAFRFLILRWAFQANEGEDRTREPIYRVIETRERMEKDRKIQI